MSGRHAAKRRRRVLPVLAFPGRLVFDTGAAAWRRTTIFIADTVTDVLEWLAERWEDRYGTDDASAEVTTATTRVTTSDQVPALAAPIEEPEPATQKPLTPADAFEELHAQHPSLPRAEIYWRFYDGAVTGEVDALAADEAGQREIVAEYATVFGSGVGERPDGVHVQVFAAGDYANVRFVIAAVLIHDDTMPLPAYREAAGTLETQEISEQVLAEAGVR